MNSVVRSPLLPGPRGPCSSVRGEQTWRRSELLGRRCDSLIPRYSGPAHLDNRTEVDPHVSTRYEPFKKGLLFIAAITGTGMVAGSILDWQARRRTLQTEPDSPTELYFPAPQDFPTPPEARSNALKTTLGSLALLFAPGTLIVALAFYFGWVRTHALYAYFGIDADELRLSTSQYVLRSTDVLWPTLAALALLVLLALAGHSWLLQHLQRPSRTRQMGVAIRVVFTLGVLLFVLGSLVFRAPSWQGTPLAALCFALSFSAMGYSRLLRSHLRALRGVPTGTGSPSRLEQSISWVVLILVTLSVFWAAAGFATDLGTGRAQALEASRFDTTPDVILYSTSRIKIDARGVAEMDLGPAYAPYRYRYSGLKLLVEANGKLFLIPFDWSTSNAFTLVLPENNSIRLAFAPNFGHP